MQVSRPVHLPVHAWVKPEPSSQAPSVKPKGRGPGPYLAKSGSVYIFQIKMPKTSGGTRAIPPLRLSLGACSHRRATLLALADLLAAKARLMFDDKRHSRGMQDDDSEMRALEAVIEMKGALKAYLGSDQPIGRTDPHRGDARGRSHPASYQPEPIYSSSTRRPGSSRVRSRHFLSLTSRT